MHCILDNALPVCLLKTLQHWRNMIREEDSLGQQDNFAKCILFFQLLKFHNFFTS